MTTYASATPLSSDLVERVPAGVAPTAIGASVWDSEPRDVDAWRTALDTLYKLPDLENGWDGERGLPTASNVFRAARALLYSLCSQGLPAPQVLPVPDGGVQLEWMNGLTQLELEVQPDGALVFVCDDPNVPGGIDGELPADEDRFVSAFTRLLSAG